MTTPLRVAAFVASVGAVFALALGVGRVVGPLDVEPSAADHVTMTEGRDGHGDTHAEEVGLPGGLAVSQDGYTLRLSDPLTGAGRDVPLGFVVEGPDGRPVTEYHVEHEKRLHLVVVRRDLTGFQHVHPTMDADGTWTARADLTPGSWRVLADVTPSGSDNLVLGADLAVPGDHRPVAPADETTTATVGDYTVTLTGELVAGAASPVALTVSKDGEPVTDLQPYLGASGHLVALREGDLAYLHVHPDDGRPGPEIPFVAEVPSDGRYHLFLDFRHDGVVRTAHLVVSNHGH